MNNKVEVVYTDGSVETLTLPTDEDIKMQDEFHEKCMDMFFPEGLTLPQI